MDNFNLPRLLTDTEESAVMAAEKTKHDIYAAAGWFLPTPDGRNLSLAGDKSDAYISDALEILKNNPNELGNLMDAANFESASALYKQARKIEDATESNLTAPHCVALIAGAAAKKFADDLYNLVTGLARLSSKWKADAVRLAARYKRGPDSSSVTK